VTTISEFRAEKERDPRPPGRPVPPDSPTHPEEPHKPGDKDKNQDKDKEEEEPQPQAAKNVSMTEAQFLMLVQELRKPTVNPQLEARRKRTREHNRALMKDSSKMLQSRFLGCNHMQFPGSVMTGCSVIAWGTQSDHKMRGICQHCGTIFSPVRSECASQEIFEAYPMLVRMPTHPGGNINTVFQSA
jgi:hypothetical protein